MLRIEIIIIIIIIIIITIIIIIIPRLRWGECAHKHLKKPGVKN